MSDNIFDGTTGNPKFDDINLPSLMALGSGTISDDAIDRLVELLRSDVPLHPSLRKMLADALSGESPNLRLTLKRKGKTGPTQKMIPGFKKALDLFTALERGRYIAEHPERNAKVENCIQDAMTRFDIQRSEAYAALKVWRDFERDAKSKGLI